MSRVTCLQIRKDDKMKVKWLDGSVYVGTVLESSTAVAKVCPVGYPKEYTLWVTQKELVADGAKESNQAGGWFTYS